MRLPADDASNSNTVTIVGAGLAGSMLALLLANDGERVRLIEKRDDIRIEHQKQLEDVRFATCTIPSIISHSIAISISIVVSLVEHGFADEYDETFHQPGIVSSRYLCLEGSRRI